MKLNEFQEKLIKILEPLRPDDTKLVTDLMKMRMNSDSNFRDRTIQEIEDTLAPIILLCSSLDLKLDDIANGIINTAIASVSNKDCEMN